MFVKINGENESIEKGISLLGVIKNKGFISERIIVEYNFKITSREEWTCIILQDNDNLEILSFMGGG